jgi:hypothetical protein
VLAEVEQVLPAERAFVQLHENQVSDDGNFSDGLARQIAFLSTRGSERHKNGTKRKQGSEAKPIGSSHVPSKEHTT